VRRKATDANTLQAQVVALCERTLRELLAAEKSKSDDPDRFVDPDLFVDSIHRESKRRAAMKRERSVELRAARAVSAIRTAVEQDAKAILAEADDLGMTEVVPSTRTSFPRVPELRQLVEHFAKLSHRPKPSPDEIEEHDGWTRRQYVLHEFDSENFLGLRREATVGELAAISLLLDPEHGCGDRRRAGTTKAWRILKQERDAMRRARTADLEAALARATAVAVVREEANGQFSLYGEDGARLPVGPFNTREEAEHRIPRPYEPLPPDKAGPYVKHREPGHYVAGLGGRMVRVVKVGDRWQLGDSSEG